MNGAPPSARDRRILAAVRRETLTSRDLARRLSSTRARMSVALCRLRDLGFVERAPNRPSGRGRPPARWRRPIRTGAGAEP